jgi:RNA polymerase primary sigma factor
MNPTDVALNRYLQEIGSIPLLTLEEEIQIARKIQRGDAAARERLIQANLRLVVTVARDYINLGLPLLDLISEGNIGLMKAVDRFDPEKGAKLSTYASWWIKQAIKRAPTEDELGEELGVAAGKGARLKRVGLRSESLDASVGDDDVTEFGETFQMNRRKRRSNCFVRKISPIRSADF